ncbi:ArsR/SmtB family transcription factor [Streptomyces huiliensis]|uniref:ArsR/SmtB family transcription factor n=1 Tax=Streptomyces huiliensis TaxID=2876027 RepID=UPI001CBAB1F5|nr:helix-turn-helix domain-containing protein [Streptomyces huiliensis]MBZ4322827.1 helix-turn-helix domain-containing protein [Streptomyces huiliensis]
MADESELPVRAAGLEPDPATDVVLDAKGLRALAHPLRVRLVGLLRTHGPSTATRLARDLGVGSGVTSYHLRQLADAGFVAEDGERGNARERWWRAAHEATWLRDKSLYDAEPEAAAAFRGSVAGVHALHTQVALGRAPSMPRPWRDVLETSDWLLRLTPGETAELSAELRAVLARYRRFAPGAEGDAPADAEQVTVVLHVLPDPAATDGPAGKPGRT